MVHSDNKIMVLAVIGTFVVITALSVDVSFASGLKDIANGDLGSGRFWEKFLRMFG